MTLDEQWMEAAIAEARKAAAMGEVPIGAVAVRDHQIIVRAHNMREMDGNPLGHAELLMLQQLARASVKNRDDVPDVSMYKTLEVDTSAPRHLAHNCSDWRSATTWRLTDVTIYVTCEPCLMCAGAMLQARIPRLVYGCADPKAGACGSLYNVTNDPRLNHRIEVVAGCRATECGALMSDFFRQLRKK